MEKEVILEKNVQKKKKLYATTVIKKVIFHENALQEPKHMDKINQLMTIKRSQIVKNLISLQKNKKREKVRTTN